MNVNLNGNLDQRIDTGFLSKVALILAVMSFICCCIDWLFSIPAAICAVIALVKNKKDGCAWAALVIAGISLAVYALAIMSGLMDDLGDRVKGNDSAVRQESGVREDSSDKSGSIDEEQGSADDRQAISDSRGTQDDGGEAAYEVTDTQFYTFVNSIGRVEYYFVMEIENTGNCNLYLDSCTLDIEDNSGRLLQASEMISSCPNVLRPGEKGYYYNGMLSSFLDESIDTSNGVRCVPNYKIEKARKEPVDYEVSDTSLRKDLGSVKLTGRITNGTNEDDPGISVYTIYYDSAGRVIGVDGTVVFDVKAGQTVSFDSSALWMSGDSSYEDIANYRVIAQKDYYQW